MKGEAVQAENNNSLGGWGRKLGGRGPIAAREGGESSRVTRGREQRKVGRGEGKDQGGEESHERGGVEYESIGEGLHVSKEERANRKRGPL
jgi:hypothetical protein